MAEDKKSKSKDVADLSGKRKDKYKVLSKTRIITPSGKKKPVRKTPIIGRSETWSKDQKNPDGPMKLTAYSAKANSRKYDTEPTKFKDIDSRHYGLKKGGRAGYQGGGRTNLLEELGRVEGESSNRNRRAEVSRIHGELNRGYKKGGRAGYKHGGAAKRGHGCEIK